MPVIYISLGSNIDREQNTRAGVQALRDAFGELELSSVYESEAVGFEGDAFYNMVIACSVDAPVMQVNQVPLSISFLNERSVPVQPQEFCFVFEVHSYFYSTRNYGKFWGKNSDPNLIHRFELLMCSGLNLLPHIFL